MMSLQRANVYLLQTNVYSNPLLTFKLGLSFFFFIVELLFIYSIHRTLIRCTDMQIFSPILWAFFSLSCVIFSTKVFNFDEVQFIHSFWLLVLLASYLRKHLSNSRSRRFTPILSSKTFIALPFTFRYLISSELIFICD